MAVVSTNLGRVGLVPKGKYSAETPYKRLDIVVYDGSAYVAVKDSTGVTPGEDETTWQLLARRGEDGPAGPAGAQGPAGTQGEKGNGITSVQENEDTSLTFNFDNLDPFKTSPLKGEKGERGERGEQGPANVIKGQAYDSLESLQTAVQDAKEGDQYNVGTEAPYNVYRWTGESWEDQGKTQGPEGPEGKQGEPGTVFVPSLADDGTLSWTNEGGLDNPPDVNIKGPQGDPGKDGEPGKAGEVGPQGEPGKAPHIGEDGTWETWDEESGDWKTTGIKAVPVTLEVTVPADGWSSGNTFSVEVQSEAIHPQDVHVAEIKQIDNEETDKPVRESWAQMTHIDAEEGKLTFHAVKEPTAEMPVEIITWTGLPGQAGISKSNVFIVRRGTVGGAAPVNSIENAEVKLVENHYVYDGQEKTQEVESVTMNGDPLTLGTDYFVVNKTATTAGTHTLEILGIRNYSGVKPVEWSIAKAQSTISVEPNSFSYSGDIGTVKTATISHFGEGEITADSNLPEVATATVEGSSLKVTCHKAGEAKITVKIADTINYDGASCDVDVSGVQLEGSLELDNQDLTVKGVMGTTGSVHFSHTGDGVVTAESQDSGTATARVEGDNIIVTSVKAGSTSITVTLPETPNYKGASAELSVIVEKADGSITLNSESLTVKGVMGTTGSVQFSHTGDGAITVESQTPTIATARYEGDTITVTSVKEGSATVDVKIEETENYTGASATLSVEVQRATGAISVQPQSLEIKGGAGTQGTAEISVTGDGEVTYDDNPKGFVTISKLGNTLTLTSVTEGNTNVTITLAESENYTGASCVLDVTTVQKTVRTFGVKWDKTTGTRLSRTDDSALFQDPVAAIGGGTGSSPFDAEYPFNGMVVSERDGNKVVAIPKYYFKWTNTSSELGLQIFTDYVEGSFVSPAHADRGDGQGERDVVYIARYHCASSSYKSVTGVRPQVSMSRATARSSIHNLGAEYFQQDFAMFWTWHILYLIEYAEWDAQKVIGFGCGNGTLQNTGSTDSMLYHTGTMESSRETYTSAIQYRNIEAPWSNVREFVDGIRFQSGSIYVYQNPADSNESSGGTLIGQIPSSAGCISNWQIPTASGFEWAAFPSEVSGTDYTIYCADRCSVASSNVVLYTGGGYGSQDRNCGPFYLYGNSATVSGSNLGARLMILPNGGPGAGAPGGDEEPSFAA